MDAWTQASAGAIPVVVSVVRIDGLRKLRGQCCDAFVVVWVKFVGIWESFFVVVQAPGVDEDNGVLRNFVPIDPVICYAVSGALPILPVQRLETRLTFGRSVRKRQWNHSAPPHRLLDCRCHVRQLRIV